MKKLERFFVDLSGPKPLLEKAFNVSELTTFDLVGLMFSRVRSKSQTPSRTLADVRVADVPLEVNIAIFNTGG